MVLADQYRLDARSAKLDAKRGSPAVNDLPDIILNHGQLLGLSSAIHDHL